MSTLPSPYYDILICEWSFRPLESTLLDFNAHDAHGFLANDYLTIIGGITGIEIFVKYVGTDTSIKNTDQDGWFGRLDPMPDAHFAGASLQIGKGHQ